MLDFRILGPLEVVTEHGEARLGGPKQRAVLAILLLDANRVVSVERLADDVYAGAAPVTAVTQVQRQVSELRKVLRSDSIIETRPPGYAIRLAPEQLDLNRFERSTTEATRALARGDADTAAELLHDALALWRGSPLADLADEPFAQIAVRRLEEIRQAATELRIEADLMLGRHALLVGELESLISAHPLRERLRAQLMLALYRSGRQAEALEAYRRARETLVGDFGIEPTPALHELQRAILDQDPSLDAIQPASARTERAGASTRSVLVLPSNDGRLGDLLTIAEPLAQLPGRELILARLVARDDELDAATSALQACRRSLDVAVRTAAFTTSDASRDAVRLAVTYDVDLVLTDATGHDGATLPSDLLSLAANSPADLAVLAGSHAGWGQGDGIYIPFGGNEHDWAALGLGAWLASGTGSSIRLVGTRADPHRGRRDASRLLADASLAVQSVVGVDAEPLLAEPDEDGLVSAVAGATLIITGMSARHAEGIGTTRRALVRAAAAVLFVHRGPRPSGLAPQESRTQFTWSIDR